MTKSIVYYVGVLILLPAFTNTSSGQQVWEVPFEGVNSLSSPRAVDLNLDGIKDIVIGGGVEEDSSQTGYIALNGESGGILWTEPSHEQVFSSSVFLDVNSDQYPDVILGGRTAQLEAYDGFSGTKLWEFYSDTISPDSVGLYNFYTGQVVPDMNGDLIQDLLVTNGGDRNALPQDTIRPPGYVMIISGIDGIELAKMVVPDSMETYCSPLVDDLGTNELWAIYGTGGETVRGGLWKTKLSDILNEDPTQSELLHSNDSNGYVGPPSLVDLNGDAVFDIVFNNFAGQIGAINGASGQLLWERSFVNAESNVNPSIGRFNSQDPPDINTTIAFGEWFLYDGFANITMDGSNGSTIDSTAMQTWNLAGTLAVDLNADDKDELVSVRTSKHFNTAIGSDVYRTTVLIQETITGDTLFQYGPHSGTNPFYTPLISDLDDDGLADIVYVLMEDSLELFSSSKMIVRRVETNLPIGDHIAWGSYIGTSFDGKFTPTELVNRDEIGTTATWQRNELLQGDLLYDIMGRKVEFHSNFLSNGIYLVRRKLGENWHQKKALILDREITYF